MYVFEYSAVQLSKKGMRRNTCLSTRNAPHDVLLQAHRDALRTSLNIMRRIMYSITHCNALRLVTSYQAPRVARKFGIPCYPALRHCLWSAVRSLRGPR